MNEVIIVKDLVKVYRNGIRANDGISFTVNEGEVFGILGPNGAGKTTLIKQLVGLLKPTRGFINVLGIDVVREPHRVKSLISLCPQETAIIGHLTVYEHLYYFARLKGLGRNEAREHVLRLIDDFGLKDHRNRLVGSLSKGLQRRVIVAQAFLGKPRIVFLDEPTTHLDPLGRHEVWDVINEYRKKGITLLLATHYMEEAEKLCDRIMFLNKGRIVTLGSVSDVKRVVGDYVKLRIPSSFLDIVSGSKGVVVTKHSLGYIEVIVPRDATLLRSIINNLIERGAIFELSTPSLEDVFIEVARK